MTVIPEMRRAH